MVPLSSGTGNMSVMKSTMSTESDRETIKDDGVRERVKREM